MSWKRGLAIFAGGLLLLLVGLGTFVLREGERLAVTTPPAADPLARLAAQADRDAPPAAAPSPSAIHQGIRYTVLRVADPEPPGLYPVKTGLRRVGILLQLEALEAAAYNFAYIRLRGSDGARYGWALTNQAPALRTGTLAAGDSVTGWVAFDLPPGVRPAALEYGTTNRAEPLLTLP